MTSGSVVEVFSYVTPARAAVDTDKNFVTGELVEPDHLWAIEDEFVDVTGHLDGNDAVGDLG
jgi:hypothetical protein